MPDVAALGRSDLNPFLFAEIGTEANGMSLSVLSAFARGGADPWSEAHRLAILPRRDAIDSLATTIAELPRSPWPRPHASAIAARLIGLLPNQPAGIAMTGVNGTGIKTTMSTLSPRLWPANQSALLLAGLALAIAVAVSALW